MGTRTIQYWKNKQLFPELDFGTFALMLYYSSKINPEKAKYFLKLSVSEFIYNSTYNLILPNTEVNQLNNIPFDEFAVKTTLPFFIDEVMPALLTFFY